MAFSCNGPLSCLVQALAAAQLEEYPAGAQYAHAAPAVLLRGTLLVRGHRASLADGLPSGMPAGRAEQVLTAAILPIFSSTDYACFPPATARFPGGRS